MRMLPAPSLSRISQRRRRRSLHLRVTLATVTLAVAPSYLSNSACLNYARVTVILRQLLIDFHDVPGSNVSRTTASRRVSFKQPVRSPNHTNESKHKARGVTEFPLYASMKYGTFCVCGIFSLPAGEGTWSPTDSTRRFLPCKKETHLHRRRALFSRRWTNGQKKKHTDTTRRH